MMRTMTANSHPDQITTQANAAIPSKPSLVFSVNDAHHPETMTSRSSAGSLRDALLLMLFGGVLKAVANAFNVLAYA